MSDTASQTDTPETCATCGGEPTVRLTVHDHTELRCDKHDGGYSMRYLRIDLRTAEVTRSRGPGGRLAVAHGTARVRSGGNYVTDKTYLAWREIMGAATTLAWLAGVEFTQASRIPDRVPEPDAATEVMRLLRSVPIDGRRGDAAAVALELASIACHALGGVDPEGSPR